jgi:hypothetical protein
MPWLRMHRTFYTTRFGRRLDRHGYVRFRNWRIYGEHGLPGQVAVVWLYGETVTVAFRDTPSTIPRAGSNPISRSCAPWTNPACLTHPIAHRNCRSGTRRRTNG